MSSFKNAGIQTLLMQKSETQIRQKPAREAKPFIKWAGGKTQLLKELALRVPPKFGNYFEPFLGGGAFFFRLHSNDLIKRAYLNDATPELMTAYHTIKTKPHALIGELSKKKYQNDKEVFYKIRAERPANEVTQTARFIYLNKTAYNGLYRVNAKGGFNVPFGKYKNPKILDKANLLAVHEALKTDELSCLDFEDAVKKARSNDFVYFDPPYQPRSKTATFTNYTAERFSEEDQRRLFRCFQRLDRKGCLTLLSNSDTQLVRKLYKDYHVRVVKASRAINCKGRGRGKINELLITNYPPPSL